MKPHKHKIRLLREARKVMSKEEHTYGVCSALNQAHQNIDMLGYIEDTGPVYFACVALKQYISGALGTKMYLSGWQRSNGFGHIADDLALLRQSRLDWIDWMIACIEEDNP